MKRQKDSYRNRVRLIAAGMIFFAALIVVRLYYVQIIHAETYRKDADKQYTNPSQKVFNRGTIYFTLKDGSQISAAALQSGYKVAIVPGLIVDAEAAYNALQAIIPLDKQVFLDKARKKDDPYEEIAKRITLAQGNKIAELKIPGVRLHEERWRMYPGGPLAAHMLGFLGYDENDNFTGRYGLEREYNDTLSRGSKNVYGNFFAELFSNINQKVFYDAGSEGDIVTTIEPNVQQYLEQELRAVHSTYRSRETAGIIMNPKTGEIYAMAAVPSFNPSEPQLEESISVFTNPLVQNVYELGSIFKPLTVAAGIDAGVITPDSTYNDVGSLTLNGRTIYNYDKKARGVVSMQEVLNQSLNTGVSHIVNLLGNQKFADYYFKYGLDESTGIDLPAEATNLMSNLRSREAVNYATASFGQGIAVTPISLTRALSVLANGGELVQPHVVKQTIFTSGKTHTPVTDPVRRVISAESSMKISRMLTTVVDKALLGGQIKFEHYSVAAKTGTAQMVKPGGGYYDDRYLHSFFGYFPSYDPKFIVFMFTSEPKGEQYASHTLTKPFQRITQYLINYYEVTPDR